MLVTHRWRAFLLGGSSLPISPTVNHHCISGGRIQFNVGTNIHHDPLYDDLPITNVAKVTPGTLYQFILHEHSTNLFTQAEQLYHVARIRFQGLEIDQLSTLNVFRSWPKAQYSRQHQDGIPYPPEFLAGLCQLANSKSVIQQISRLQLLRPSMQYPSLSVLQQALGCESPSELMFIPELKNSTFSKQTGSCNHAFHSRHCLFLLQCLPLCCGIYLGLYECSMLPGVFSMPMPVLTLSLAYPVFLWLVGQTLTPILGAFLLFNTWREVRVWSHCADIFSPWCTTHQVGPKRVSGPSCKSSR